MISYSKVTNNTDINPNTKIRNTKQYQMTEMQKSKIYDLEERTLEFARRVRIFVKIIPRTISNIEDGKQLIRSSGSVGANYIEANESLSKKDFILRSKICRKEAKESKYWIVLVDTNDDMNLDKEREALAKEADELTKIFGAIIRKSE